MRRDDRLGAELRRLPVPEHREGFWDGLGAGAAPPPRRSRDRLLWLTGAAAAAAVALVAGLLVRTGPGPDEGSPAAGRDQAVMVSGVFEVGGAGSDPKPWGFQYLADGSFRMWEHDVAPDSMDATEYSAPSRTQLTLTRDPDGTDTFSRRSRLAHRPATGVWPFIDLEFAAAVPALAAEGDERVTETTVDGRRAWQLSAELSTNEATDLDADRLEMVVDAETGFPLSRVLTRDGRVVYSLRARASFEPEPERREIEPPRGVDAIETDAGFRDVAPGSLKGEVAYEPVNPSWLPDGFALTSSLVGEVPDPTGPEGVNPPMTDVVQLTYRRGWEAIRVTTWLREPAGYRPPPGGIDWHDPLSAGEGIEETSARLRLSGGALSEAVGHSVVDIHATPRVFVVGEDVVATVAGPLPRADLVRIAESLRGA